jgi:hypothetical protein
MNTRIRTVLAAAASAVALGAMATPAAQAGITPLDLSSCSDDATSQVFKQWGDPFSYSLAPDGGFEARADGWTLTGGATVEAGNESFYAHDAGDRSSLSLPPGSSATSPEMCASIDRPLFRFFTRNAGSAFSNLKVEVLASGPLGNVTLVQPGLITRSSWTPSLPMPIPSNLLAGVSGGATSFALRFSPTGRSGDWSIDDVYVDPYAKR